MIASSSKYLLLLGETNGKETHSMKADSKLGYNVAVLVFSIFSVHWGSRRLTLRVKVWEFSQDPVSLVSPESTLCFPTCETAHIGFQFLNQDTADRKKVLQKKIKSQNHHCTWNLNKNPKPLFLFLELLINL